MKVSIIGGGGRVGSNAAFAMQCAAIVSEIHLLDANEQMAQGEALDLLHGASVAGDQKIYAGGYDKCADSDVIVITAGLRRKPDESRLDLINRNVALFKQILDSLKIGGLKKDAIIFVVSNPVDILTRLAIDHLKRDPNRTIGLGTQLDTARFRSLIALETGSAPQPDQGADSRRAWRQHGADLVQRDGGGHAAGETAELFPGSAAAGLRAHENQRSGVHQAQRRRGVGRGADHRGSGSCDRSEPAEGFADQHAACGGIWNSRHLHELANAGESQRRGETI